MDNILVVEGLFAATMDFGQSFASTAPRFLEIDVRADTGLDCSSATGFVTLATRTLLTATPLATHAKSAFSLDAPDGSHPNALIVDNGGRIGVGTAAPTHSVHIAAAVPAIALQDTTAASQQSGYVSYRDNANVERAWDGYGTAGSPEFSMVNARFAGNLAFWAAGAIRLITNGGERMTIDSLGNVGIGTTAPSGKLDVHGEIRYGSNGQYRPIAGEEPLRTIRGRIGSAGNIGLGSGFTVLHTSTGRYAVTFATPFTGTPVITANVALQSTFLPGSAVISSTTTGASIFLFDMNGGALDQTFDFIAVGPR